LFSVHEEEEAAARKKEQARRRTERERAKAQHAQDARGDIPDEGDSDDEREERSSGTVDQFSFFYILAMLIQPNPQVFLSKGSLKTL
jgi:hypothetical protein